MPVCGYMSHIQSGPTLWPLVSMLVLSLGSFSCSPALPGFLVLVGLVKGAFLGSILLRISQMSV